MNDTYLSVVIPVYNEETNLPILFKRLTAVLDGLKKPWEIIFTNDGSKDKTAEILEGFYKERPNEVCVINFSGNYGQHMAIMAGFEKARGQVIATMDADLQNPPEEIPNLLKEYDAGFDYVGGIRSDRDDNFFRVYISKAVNYVRERLTNIRMKDHGCMLRIYSRSIIDQIIQCEEPSTFITALAYTFSHNPKEIVVEHAARTGDESKYDAYKLVRVTLDLFTGFSMAPLHMFVVFGIGVSALSGILVAYLLMRRVFIGPEAEGLFTLMAILMFLVSVAITGIGIVGEYIGKIYEIVRKRPRFVIKNALIPTESKSKKGR
jgi:undecaprenyl-phosphate 4-deoxy-4-formamido-L-arabinose transferase